MTDRLDPLEASKQIEESYKRYLKTLLAPRNQQLAAAGTAATSPPRAVIRSSHRHY